MDYNELLNFEDYIDNVSQMGVQNEITHKALYPCFQIPNAPPACVLEAKCLLM